MKGWLKLEGASAKCCWYTEQLEFLMAGVSTVEEKVPKTMEFHRSLETALLLSVTGITPEIEKKFLRSYVFEVKLQRNKKLIIDDDYAHNEAQALNCKSIDFEVI